MKSTLSEAELARYVQAVCAALDGLNVGEGLAIVGGIASALLSELPDGSRGGYADSWFEIIVSESNPRA